MLYSATVLKLKTADMLTRYHRYTVILLLILLSPILPGKMNFCLLPGGEIHLEADCSTPCGLATVNGPEDAESGDQFCRQNVNEQSCLDFTVDGNAARQQNQGLTDKSPLALLIQAQPRSAELLGQIRPREQPLLPSPHLKSHQITVLRI